MRIRFIQVLLIASLCSGSAIAKSVSPGNYTPLDVVFRGDDQQKAKDKLRSNLIKAEKTKSQKPQVIVPEFIVSTSDLNDDAGIVAQQSLKQQLLQGGAQIVDRAIGADVRKEIDFIAQTGGSRGVTFETADYYFKGEILSVSNSANFREATSYTNDEGKVYRIPSKCDYSSSATASLNIYSMNPFEIIDTFVLDGKSARQQENVSYCVNIDYTPLYLDAIRSIAAANADELKDIFAPKGWIIDRRMHPKKGDPEKGKHLLFKTSLDSSINTQSDVPVQVFKVVDRYDLSSDSIKKEKALIGTGEIVDATGDNGVWIEMDNRKDAAQILLGDLVEIRNSEICVGSLLEKMKCKAKRAM